MNTAAPLRYNWMQGVAALGVVVAATLLFGLIAAALVGRIGSQAIALAEKAEITSGLEDRLAEQRLAISTKLRQIGANPTHLALLSDSKAAIAAVNQVCAAAAASLGAACTLQSEPMSPLAHRHLAQITATANFDAVRIELARLGVAPMSIIEIRATSAADPGMVEVTALVGLISQAPISPR